MHAVSFLNYYTLGKNGRSLRKRKLYYAYQKYTEYSNWQKAIANIFAKTQGNSKALTELRNVHRSFLMCCPTFLASMTQSLPGYLKNNEHEVCTIYNFMAKLISWLFCIYSANYHFKYVFFCFLTTFKNIHYSDTIVVKLQVIWISSYFFRRLYFHDLKKKPVYI